MGAVELVVTDLDGTLWDATEAVHDRTLAALAQLEARPLQVLVATGRRVSSSRETLERAGLRLPGVFLDGALGLDLATGVEFHRRGHDPAAAEAILDTFLAHGIEPCIYIALPDVEALIGDAPSTHPRHLERLGALARRADLRKAVREHVVLSFGVVAGEPDALLAVAADVAHLAAPSVSRDLIFGSVTLMVPALGVSKWDGVLAFCAERGIDPTRVLAIGDGENDLTLLGNAAVACVVSDGASAALDLAHHVLAPPAEGGWADILGLVG